MIESVQVGDVVYTIAPTIESANYGERIAEPRIAKVTDVDDSGFITVSVFDPETGAIDDDSNATSICSVEDLYQCQVDAYRVFVLHLREEHRARGDRLALAEERLRILNLNTSERVISEPGAAIRTTVRDVPDDIRKAIAENLGKGLKDG